MQGGSGITSAAWDNESGHELDHVVKRIKLECGCAEELTVRPRESRMYLKVGSLTECRQHGQQKIIEAEEISGNVPLLKDIIG